MIRNRIFDPNQCLSCVCAALAAVSMSFVFVSGANALQEEEEEINRQMSTEVGEPILEVQELLDAEPTDWNRVLQILNDTLQNEDPTPYERSVILQLRGNTYYNLDNIRAAIRDWQGALDTGALVADERITLRTNMGQLYFILEEFQAGIAQFQAALNEGAQLNANLSKLLASAYVQAAQSEPDGSSAAQRLYREGLQYAEAFYRLETNKTENDYSLVQLYYIELNRPQDELRVVRASLQDYPGSRRSWQNLVSLFARLERDEDAFEANKMMYLNGLFEEEEELFRLVQYYSYFENPYRGASILEREINAGRVPANERYLEALANMWRQASEFDRAIPVLERLSQTVQDGETALKLAEAYYQENDLPRAEVALETALQRGGLDETGKAWELLGTIRYNQDKRQGALQAFRRATDFRATRRTSSDWIRFVNAQIAGAQRRQLQRIQVQIEECALTIEAERRQLVLIGSEDESGRVAFPDGSIPDRCLAYFEPLYGQQIRTAEMTDEEFAQSEADRAAREAEEAAQAAG